MVDGQRETRDTWDEIKAVLPQVLALLIGIGYMVGFIAVRQFAGELGVDVVDLDVSTQDYLAMTAAGTLFALAVLGLIGSSLWLVGAAATRRVNGRWSLDQCRWAVGFGCFLLLSALALMSEGGTFSLITGQPVGRSNESWPVSLAVSALGVGAPIVIYQWAWRTGTKEAQAAADNAPAIQAEPERFWQPAPAGQSDADKAVHGAVPPRHGPLVIGVLVTIVFAAGISTWGATEGAQRWADQLTDATVEAADPPVWIELVLAANEGEIIEADGSTTCVVRLSQRVLINADGAVRVDPEALPFRPKECMKDL